MRSNYWSCSKFADWLRGTAKLSAGTGKQWRLWRQAAKDTHPIRYWIVEEGLDYAQNFVNWPMDRVYDVRSYINNRFVSRTNSLTAHSRDIRPGSWSDVGNRFLPCLFNELVDFVEVETAAHHVLWDDKVRDKYSVPWNRRFLRFGTWRCPQAGIDHLKWAMSLTNEEWLDADQKHLTEPTLQAKNAREMLELYTWWTEVYAKRPDVHDASGWTDYCVSRRGDGLEFFDMEERSPEDAEQCRVALDKSQEIEKAYADEDEAMMIRLIKIRESLWT